MASLPKLTMLDLNGTKIADAGLEALASFPGLLDLRIGGTAVTDAGMRSIAKITRLRSLGLFNTKVTNAGIAELRGLSGLEFLNILGTKVDDGAVKTISGFKNLQILKLYRSQLTVAGTTALRQALPNVKLEMLEPPKAVIRQAVRLEPKPTAPLLGRTILLSTRGPSRLKQILVMGGNVQLDPDDMSVARVWLDKTKAGDDDLEIVTRLPKLRELYIGGTKVTSNGLPQLATLPMLEILDLGNTGIDDAGLADLALFPGLQELGLAGNRRSPTLECVVSQEFPGFAR